MYISVEVEDGGFLSAEDRTILLRFCKTKWSSVRHRYALSGGVIIVHTDSDRWLPLLSPDCTIQLGQHPSSGVHITRIIRVGEG